HVVIGVIANAVTKLHDLLEPSHAGLLKDAANHEEMHLPAGFRNAPCSADGVLLCGLIQFAFLVVPFGLASLGVVGAHLTIERDGYESRLFLCCRKSCGCTESELDPFPARHWPAFTAGFQ